MKFYFLCMKMEFQKITTFLDMTFDNTNLPKFVTKKQIEVYDKSEGNYNPNKEIRIKTSMLKSDLCDYSDAYIVVKENITVVKKIFTASNFEVPIIQQLMQMLLILQIIIYLVKKVGF